MFYNNSLDITQVRVREQSYITRVYGWMCFALAVTTLTAAYVASDITLLKIILTNKLLFFGIIILELVAVVAMTAAINRISFVASLCLFIVYSILNGVTMSVILIAFTATSVASTFFATSATFALMSCYGWYTKKDLTSIGSLCFMGLLGIIIGSLVNIFLHSSMMYWLITYVGVIIFVGLIAYDTQKIKALASNFETNSEGAKKSALVGALALYLDFINLFIMLLRIFGDRR